MIYFRVAIRMEQSSLWQWKSSMLNTPGTLFKFLNIYDGVAQNRLRVFFATSKEFLNEMLVRENKGLLSNSVTVEQFMKVGKRIDGQNIKQFESELGLQANKELVAKSANTGHLGEERSPFHANFSVEPANPVTSEAKGNNRERNLMELMQEETVRERGGDYDTPYTFTLPVSMREALIWTRLLAKVQRGELEP